jgi:hypothetical protein
MRPRRGRRRRPEPPLEGEILPPEAEPTPRIRVEIVRRAYQPRQRSTVPPWVIATLIFAGLCWLNPLGVVIAIVMISVLLTEHPTIAIAIGVIIAALVIIAIRERRAGRPF